MEHLFHPAVEDGVVEPEMTRIGKPLGGVAV
jgi:hypothetical protein